MKNAVEASPFIETIGDVSVKNDLYLQSFDVKRIGNIRGTMPLLGVDFHETEESYASRLRTWKMDDYQVLFDGWVIKDMKHWQIATNRDGVTILIEFDTYTVTNNRKEFKFPKHPDTIDDFINDCKRIDLKLFWKQEIIDKFGVNRITRKKFDLN